MKIRTSPTSAARICAATTLPFGIPPDGDFYLDILTRLREAAQYADLETEIVNVEGIPIRVVSPAELYRLKKDTVRGQDRLDAERLREKYDLDDDED